MFCQAYLLKCWRVLLGPPAEMRGLRLSTHPHGAQQVVPCALISIQSQLLIRFRTTETSLILLCTSAYMRVRVCFWHNAAVVCLGVPTAVRPYTPRATESSSVDSLHTRWVGLLGSSLSKVKGPSLLSMLSGLI
jgi:hypothetical protein